MFKLKKIVPGVLIPWGFSIFCSHEIIEYEGGAEMIQKEQLVLCIRLPFYYRDIDFYSNRECWGSAVLRIRFFDSFNIVWVPDYNFGRI
jgi:hypothetical protein